MRDFAKIAPQLWTGSTGRAIRRLGRDCQVVAFYLMTCPTANALGLYYLPIATLSYETGISAQGALKALQSLSQVGFSAYDAPSEWVFVFNMARFQIGERLEAKDNRVKWIKRSLETLRKAPFFNEFLNRYRDAFQLDDISPSEAPSEDHRSSETETETEKEKQQSGSRPISKPRKPEIPLPDDWKLTPELRRYAAEHGRDPDLEAERFKAHARANDVRHRNWDAAFQRWCLSDFGRTNGNGARPQPASSKIPTSDEIKQRDHERQAAHAEKPT